MPTTSEAQEHLMQAAAHTQGGYDGVPQEVGKEFVAADSEQLPVNELTIAKQIQSGELSSPQVYENITLFDVRITGTGTSYRSSLDEYVYRPPEDFLSDEFLERCNGLPLIFEHPTESTILNTDEYRSRAIGTIILPYIKDDEVWGIAKVFDSDAAELMKTTHASTSPAVVFRDAGSATEIDVNGQSVLIEGKPSYLDHLAICEQGVWDKGGEPSGIINNGESKMDKDENMPAWADALIKRMDSMDEKARKDSEDKEKEKLESKEEGKAEERKDSDKEEEEKKEVEAKRADEEEKAKEEKADSAKRDADMQAKIAALQAQLMAVTVPMSASDRDELSKAQSRADGIAQMFGDSVNAPLFGESPIAYRKRLVEKFKQHSAEFKVARLDSLDGSAFDLVEAKIYADAQAAALSPAAETTGRLIPMVRRDSAGREITTYAGDMNAWMGNFKAAGTTVKFNRNSQGA